VATTCSALPPETNQTEQKQKQSNKTPNRQALRGHARDERVLENGVNVVRNLCVRGCPATMSHMHAQGVCEALRQVAAQRVLCGPYERLALHLGRQVPRLVILLLLLPLVLLLFSLVILLLLLLLVRYSSTAPALLRLAMPVPVSYYITLCSLTIYGTRYSIALCCGVWWAPQIELAAVAAGPGAGLGVPPGPGLGPALGLGPPAPVGPPPPSAASATAAPGAAHLAYNGGA
jgi:hypothetical protein